MTIIKIFFYLPGNKLINMKTRLVIEIDKNTKEKFIEVAKKDGRTLRWLIVKWIKSYIDDPNN